MFKCDFPWQERLGWLTDYVPSGEISPVPLDDLARKITYYMWLGFQEGIVYEDYGSENAPQDAFVQLQGGKGFYVCKITPCDLWMRGAVYGFRKWVMPKGVLHYMIDHNWRPAEEFLEAVAELPDAPEFTIPSWFVDIERKVLPFTD